MTYCTNCGTQIPEGVRFCSSCGAAAPHGGAASAQPFAGGSPVASDAQANKAMGVLAYLGILVLIPIFAVKESRFARYHANQGLLLALAEVAFAIVYSVIVSILTGVLLGTGAWGLWSVLTTILGLLWLVFLVLAVIGIVDAVNGRCRPLPVIGHITLLK